MGKPKKEGGNSKSKEKDDAELLFIGRGTHILPNTFNNLIDSIPAKEIKEFSDELQKMENDVILNLLGDKGYVVCGPNYKRYNEIRKEANDWEQNYKKNKKETTCVEIVGLILFPLTSLPEADNRTKSEHPENVANLDRRGPKVTGKAGLTLSIVHTIRNRSYCEGYCNAKLKSGEAQKEETKEVPGEQPIGYPKKEPEE